MSRVAKTDEADFRRELHEALLPTFDVIPMETRMGDGLPDELLICKNSGQTSLVELKQYNVEGPYESFCFSTLKPEQSVFLSKRVQQQKFVNALVLGRVNRREYIALPAMADVDWTIWSRRTISLKTTPRFPIIRLRSYDQIAELLRQNLHLLYGDRPVQKPSPRFL